MQFEWTENAELCSMLKHHQSICFHQVFCSCCSVVTFQKQTLHINKLGEAEHLNTSLMQALLFTLSSNSTGDHYKFPSYYISLKTHGRKFLFQLHWCKYGVTPLTTMEQLWIYISIAEDRIWPMNSLAAGEIPM